MASRRTPGAVPRCTERGKGADSERLPLSPCGAKRELRRDPGLRAGSWDSGSVGNSPRVSAPSPAGGRRLQRGPFLPQLPGASKPPASAAAAASRRQARSAAKGGGARSAPRRAH